MLSLPLKAPPRRIPHSMRALHTPRIRRQCVATCACTTSSAPPSSCLGQHDLLDDLGDAWSVTPLHCARERGRFDRDCLDGRSPYLSASATNARGSYGILPTAPFHCNPQRGDQMRTSSWCLVNVALAAAGGRMDAAYSGSQFLRFSTYVRHEGEPEVEISHAPASSRRIGSDDPAAWGGAGAPSWPPKPKADVRDLQSRTRQALLKEAALALELEGLFQEWNTTLKHVKNPASLRRSVELVDQLVRHNHRIREHASSSRPSSVAESADETFAAFVGVSAWARVSAASSHAAPRAQQLFELLPPPNLSAMPSDLQANYVWHRRNVYNALLLAWSRSASPEAAEACDMWLAAMKAEEATYRYASRLVNVHAYNYVLASHAKRGDAARVREVWSEMERSSGVHPNAQSYDARIKAYQAVDDPHLKATARIRVGEIFRDQLRRYRALKVKKPSARPLALTLARVLFMYTYMPDEARALLDAALELEREHPECRGLVNIRHVGLVLNALTGKDRVEEAEHLLSSTIRIYDSDSNKHLRPDKKAFGIVMDGYAQRSHSRESLRKVEALLTRLEERLIKSQGLSTQHSDDEMDATAYNILMTAYLRAWPDDAVKKMQLVIERMERIGSQTKKSTLLPDSVTYAILMKALVRRASPGFERDVEAVLRGMEQECRDEAKPTRRAYFEALRSWAKSESPDAPAKVRDVLNSIGSPDTACYNVAIRAFGRWGNEQDAMRALQKMKDDFASGRNRACRPDAATYTAVLGALCKTDRANSSSRWEKALACFDDMSDSFLKGNACCRPNQASISALLEGLRASKEVNDKALAARDVLMRLDRLRLSQGRETAIAMINACGESRGPPTTRLEAAKFIAGLVKSLPRSHLSDEVFRAGLESCQKLLYDANEEWDLFASALFTMCKDAGHMSQSFWETLRRTCSSSLYARLTSQDVSVSYARLTSHDASVSSS